MVHLRFKKLLLSPGDHVTIYDPTLGIARYDRTENLLVSVKSKGDSIRVVVNTSGNRTTIGRRFSLDHKALSPGKDVKTYNNDMLAVQIFFLITDKRVSIV